MCVKRAVIIVGGEAPADTFIKKVCGEADLVLAADSGVEIAAATGVTPQVVVGDFDSVSVERTRALFPNAKTVQSPAAKDETDTELALGFARRRGYVCCDVVGGGGGRLDHLLAILALMDRDDGPDRWFTNTAEVRRVSGHLAVTRVRGSIVSVFPCGGAPARARSSGLRWPLDGIVWRRGVHGVSNEVEDRQVEISVDSGALLIVLPLAGATPSAGCDPGEAGETGEVAT